jgi:hypothetical protein
MERWNSADPDRHPQRLLPSPDLTKINPETRQYWLYEAGGRDLCVRYGRALRALTYGAPPGIGDA